MTNRTQQRGFTLIELIVSLGLGAIITLTLFTLTAGSGRIFHEQQRIAHTQLALRNAVERVRADIARAGYLTTPMSTQDTRVCPVGSLSCPNPPLQGVSLVNADGAAAVNLPATNALVAPDRLDLFGAFDDSNVYFSQTVDAGTITLDPNTVSFQQRFGAAPAAGLARLITETFDPTTKVVRIHCPGDPIVFQAITAPATSAPPTITIPFGAYRAVGPYQPSSMGMRCEISTANFVSYQIRNVCGVFPATCRTGGEPEKSDLVRVTMLTDGVTPVAAETRIVAEYAVDFDVRFGVDNVATPPLGTIAQPRTCTTTYAGAGAWAVAGAGSLAGRLRAVEFRLSVRARDEDPAFPFVAPGGLGGVDPVVQRFKLNALTTASARVRTMRTRVELTSFAGANIQRPGPGGALCPNP